MRKEGFDLLKEDVIDTGLCHGCGTCVGVCPDGVLTMSYGPAHDGDPEPVLKGKCGDCILCYDVCPGRIVPLPEIDTMVFGRRRDQHHESLGILRECLGGFSRNEAWRTKGAGGGATLAILDYALRNRIIDAAIVGANDEKKPWRVKPALVTSPQELSRIFEYSYSLVPINSLLTQASKLKKVKKIAVVGLPCHIQGLRKMQLLGNPRTVLEKIGFSLSVFCPTNFFWQYTKHILVEKCGIEDFRTIAHLSFHGGASPKHLVVTLKDGKEMEVDLFTLIFWGIGNFIHQRCAVCYDWTGEVADISVGDFWEPWLNAGDQGWSTIITRTEIGEAVVHGAQDNSYLYARPTPEEFLVASFAWEIKKHASAYRLAWRAKYTSNPVPDYGYPIEEALEMRPPKCAPWRVPSRLYGLLPGVPPEESR